ncbi:MAG: YbaB/EbfC family nucleoid-associated protein [Candidatus Omnitrophota bacterium]
MFDKMKALMDMQKKMQEMKKQLENTTFDVQSSNGLIKITMNGAQEITDIKVVGDLAAIQAKALEQAMKDAFTKAIKQSQVVAAEKMKSVTGFNLPGLT